MEDAEKEFNERMYEYLVDVLINKNPYAAKAMIIELHEKMAISENKKISSMGLAFGCLNEDYKGERLTYAAYNSLFNETVIDEELLFQSVRNGEFVKVLDSFGHESTHAVQASREKAEGKREFKLDAETLLASMVLFPEVQEEFFKEGLSLEGIAYFNYFSEKDEVEARDNGGKFAKSFLAQFKSYGNEALNQIIDGQIKLHGSDTIFHNIEQLKTSGLVKMIRDNIKGLIKTAYPEEKKRFKIDLLEHLKKLKKREELELPIATNLTKVIQNEVIRLVRQPSVSREMAEKILDKLPLDSFLANAVNIHENIDAEAIIRLVGFPKYADLAESRMIDVKEKSLTELVRKGFVPKGIKLSEKQKNFVTDNFLLLTKCGMHNFLEGHGDEQILRAVSEQVKNSGFTVNGIDRDNRRFSRELRNFMRPYKNDEFADAVRNIFEREPREKSEQEKQREKRKLFLKNLYEVHKKIGEGLVNGSSLSEETEPIKKQILRDLNDQRRKAEKKLHGFGGLDSDYDLISSINLEIIFFKDKDDKRDESEHKNKLVVAVRPESKFKPKEEIKE